MGVFKTYLMPFDESGNYTEFQEITRFTDQGGIGALKVDVDSTDYQLGVFRNSNFNISLNNRSGKFSDIDNIESLFRYKRADSQVKVTWRIQEKGPHAGVMRAGFCKIGEEVEVFKGLLNDDSFSSDLVSDNVKFSVLGFESTFLREKVPFADISNGDDYSEVMFALLNQTKITDLLTVDIANITPSLDQTIDAVAPLENKTVKEAMDLLLLATNSILYILNDTIYVKARTPSASVVHTFYGQASTLGPENAITISDIKNGLSRTFNFITWSEASPVGEDATSSLLYGIRKKELNLEFMTDNTKRQNLINNLITEFGMPKQEFTLKAPVTYKTLALNLLDKVQVDYPTVLVGDQIPICGVAEYGEAQLPDALWSFTVTTDDYYKIIAKTVNPKDQTIDFRLREI